MAVTRIHLPKICKYSGSMQSLHKKRISNDTDVRVALRCKDRIFNKIMFCMLPKRAATQAPSNGKLLN